MKNNLLVEKNPKRFYTNRLFRIEGQHRREIDSWHSQRKINFL